LTEKTLSISRCEPAPLTLANPARDVKELGGARREKLRQGAQRSLASCGLARLLYWNFAMRKENRPNRNSLPRIVARATLPTRYGRFTIYGFTGNGKQEEAVALVRGKLREKKAPLVRVHSQCLTGDVLTSLRCDCRAQLELSLKKIGQASCGVLLYLPQEGRGIGLMNKLRAYELQDRGMDTVEANESLGFAADAREYEFPAKILKRLGAKKIRLLSNNPEKVRQLEAAGIRVVERVPCQPRISKISRAYLKVKKSKLGHLLEGL
jgi:GTP cyclohydrolase II